MNPAAGVGAALMFGVGLSGGSVARKSRMVILRHAGEQGQESRKSHPTVRRSSST
jgi:hypothetical protein